MFFYLLSNLYFAIVSVIVAFFSTKVYPHYFGNVDLKDVRNISRQMRNNCELFAN